MTLRLAKKVLLNHTADRAAGDGECSRYALGLVDRAATGYLRSPLPDPFYEMLARRHVCDRSRQRAVASLYSMVDKWSNLASRLRWLAHVEAPE